MRISSSPLQGLFNRQSPPVAPGIYVSIGWHLKSRWGYGPAAQSVNRGITALLGDLLHHYRADGKGQIFSCLELNCFHSCNSVEKKGCQSLKTKLSSAVKFRIRFYPYQAHVCARVLALPVKGCANRIGFFTGFWMGSTQWLCFLCNF